MLDKWRARNVQPIKQIVTDGSKALQNCISLSYNNCSFKTYLNWCHEAVIKNKSDMPPCFIRADIAHLIKCITRWPCFHGYSWYVKDFYVSLVGFLSKVVNYQQFIETVKNIFVVCQSPEITIDSFADTALKNLINVIETHTIKKCEKDCDCDSCNELTLVDLDEDENDSESKSDNGSDNKCDNSNNVLMNDIMKLQKNSEHLISKKGEENKYYCPDVMKNFLNLFSEYPIWTNIMIKKFNTNIEVATSGRSKALFADLRHISRLHSNPPVINENPNENKRLNTRERGKFLRKCADLREKHSRPSMKKLKMLTNANEDSVMEYNRKKYEFDSSYLFDSLFELCLSACSNYANFKNIIVSTCTSHFCINTSIINYMESGNYTNLRKDRLKHCLKYFTVENGTIKCNLNVKEFVKTVFQDCEIISIENELIIELEKSIEDELFNANSLANYVDKHLKIKNKKFQAPLLFLTMDQFNNSNSIHPASIPINLEINNELYFLAGMISSSTSKYDENLLHYVAYCRSVNDRWSVKDDQQKKSNSFKISKLEHTEEKIDIILYVHSTMN
uniref:USP domain-containing protein n=1 Tax=Trichogramma kaykai TaxID=54128 RepID=A0ABD2WRP7_9HYME